MYTTDSLIVPALKAYKPEFILVSCGFDANAFDPLARMMLCSSTYQYMTEQLMKVAEETCMGRLCYIHEGGLLWFLCEGSKLLKHFVE